MCAGRAGVRRGWHGFCFLRVAEDLDFKEKNWGRRCLEVFLRKLSIMFRTANSNTIKTSLIT